MKTRKERIAWELVLSHGEKNAISGEELRRRLGFGDARSVRTAVVNARLAGVPVLSLQRSEQSGGGYFLPDKEKPEEVGHTVGELRKRAYTSLKQAAALSRWLADNTGKGSGFEQMSISEFMKEQERADDGGTE